MRTIALALLAITTLHGTAIACDDHASKPGKRQPRASATPLVHGEVRDVDANGGSITLAHGRIPSLRMQPMGSMVFKVDAAAAIHGLKPGDKVRFRAASVAGQPTVIEIEAAPRQ